MNVALVLIVAVAAAVVALLTSFARPQRGLALSVLALPIYWVPDALLAALAGLMTSSQIPIAADVVVVATLAGLIVWNRKRRVRPPAPVTRALLIFIVFAVLSTWNSVSWGRSFANLIAYGQLAMMTFVIETIPNSAEEFKRVGRVWMYSLVIVLVGGVIGSASAYAGLENFSVLGTQVRSTFRFPNQLSLYLVMSCSMASAYLVTPSAPRHLRRIAAWSIPIALLVMLTSGSRSGLTAATGTAAMLLWLHGRRNILYVPLAIVVAVVIITSANTIGSQDNWQEVRDRYAALMDLVVGQQTDALDFYSATNQVAWNAFYDHPVIGGGIGAVLDTALDSDQPYEIHNTYLGLLGQVGLVGIATFIFTIVTALRNAWIARRIARDPLVNAFADSCLAAIVGCGIHAMGNFDWRVRHLWLLLAFTSVVRMAAERSAIRTPQAVVPVAAGGWVPARQPLQTAL